MARRRERRAEICDRESRELRNDTRAKWFRKNAQRETVVQAAQCLQIDEREAAGERRFAAKASGEGREAEHGDTVLKPVVGPRPNRTVSRRIRKCKSSRGSAIERRRSRLQERKRGEKKQEGPNHRSNSPVRLCSWISMSANQHFASVPNWAAAREMLTFVPFEPTFTAGLEHAGLRIFIRDHKMRDVPVGDRSLEAHYGRFVFSQSRKGADEARRLALDVSYGREPHEAMIAGHAGRMYELGPEPEPGDPDSRMPSVVTWHDGEMFFLVASGEMPVADLIPIAISIYRRRTP